MFLRKIIILPVFIFASIGIYALILGNVFNFFLWLFLAMAFFLVVYPISTDMDDRQTPVFQIVSSMSLFALFFAIATFFDFSNVGISTLESALYGLAFGIMLVAFIMVLKGND